MENALKSREFKFVPSSKQLDELKQSYESRIKVITKNTSHWKR